MPFLASVACIVYFKKRICQQNVAHNQGEGAGGENTAPWTSALFCSAGPVSAQYCLIVLAILLATSILTLPFMAPCKYYIDRIRQNM